jgi:hypothetical protein
MTAEQIPGEHPGNYWLFLTRDDYNSRGVREAQDKVAEAVEARGGEFRISVYPWGGHDAWTQAWREDAAWDWLFSKRLGRTATREDAEGAKILRTIFCEASVRGRDAASGSDHGGDGLDGTQYVSARPVKAGDWWQAGWLAPITGKFTVETGTRDGQGKLSAGRVVASMDGVEWFPAGVFNQGVCVFTQHASIQFLRVLPEPEAPEALIVRKVVVAPL